MSKAFTKEDDDEIPDRVGRKRTSSGLPPGAVNYMSEEGERRLRAELETLQARPPATTFTAERIAQLSNLLASATVVPARTAPPGEVLFGTTVTFQAADGTRSRLRIVGVDETDLELGWISWQSPVAKSLLGASVGQHVQIPEIGKVEIVKIAP